MPRIAGSHEESSTSEDLKALQQEDYMTSEDECALCHVKRKKKKKIYSQFKEMSLNVIDNDKILDLLQDIKN
ncbi:hypothetical protein H5410_004756 [Solanum commersonii]|uniref:Uncharacterized protein n=1 Tax=Solanum commersonii TaxID=4109 RepID=A0A9J6A591_SOLCO|nr:hypothetical protein H5410_004756 [Solanum commersonii]